MIFREPQRYVKQYLLIPVRVVLFFPLLASLLLFVLLMKAYIVAIGLIALSILFGTGWLIDNYLWVDFSNSALAGLLAFILIWPLWLGVAWCLGVATTWLSKVTGLSASGVSISRYYDWFMAFMFEAKYQDSPFDLYGPTFQEPKLEDFNLISEEYHTFHRRYSRTSPYYERVRDYEKAKKIYDSIQTEIRKRRIDAEFEARRLR